MNLNVIKTKEARVGAIIVLVIVLIIVGINVIKSSTKSNDKKVIVNAENSTKKLGVVKNIEHNKRTDNYIITIVFDANNKDNNTFSKTDTVKITVERHLLKSVLKNYEVPANNAVIQQIAQSEENNAIILSKPTHHKPLKKETLRQSEPQLKTTAATKKEDINFRVQFHMSKQLIANDDEKFIMLDDVLSYKDGNYYKYTTGKTKTFKQALEVLESIQDSYPEAFVIAFDNDNRISVLEAKKILRR